MNVVGAIAGVLVLVVAVAYAVASSRSIWAKLSTRRCRRILCRDTEAHDSHLTIIGRLRYGRLSRLDDECPMCGWRIGTNDASCGECAAELAREHARRRYDLQVRPRRSRSTRG